LLERLQRRELCARIVASSAARIRVAAFASAAPRPSALLITLTWSAGSAAGNLGGLFRTAPAGVIDNPFGVAPHAAEAI
jgi:hypothetical protein